jgi:hypothetical protein
MADATVGSAASDYGTKVTPQILYIWSLPSVASALWRLGRRPSSLLFYQVFFRCLENRGLPQIENRKILLNEQRIGFTPRGSMWAHMAKMSSCVYSQQSNRPNSQIGLPVHGPGGASKLGLMKLFPRTHFDPAPTGCRLHVNMCMQPN